LSDGTVLVWNVHSGVVQAILGKHETRVTSIDIHRQQYVVSGSEDQLVHIYNLGSHGDSDGSSIVKRRSRAHLVGLKNDSRLPITVIKCLSDVPMAACFDSDMCCRMYDLKSGQLVGELGTSSDGSWASVLGVGNSNAYMIDARGDQLSVLALPQADWPSFVESSEKCDALIEAATRPQRDEVEPEEDEQAVAEHANPPPVLPSTSLNMYFTVDVICDLCPGIEKACYASGSRSGAKHLFVTTDPEKRVDAAADIGGLGGMGGVFDFAAFSFSFDCCVTAGSFAANEGFDPVKMALSQQGGARAPSTLTGGSRSSRKKSSSSRGQARMSSRSKTQQASLGGLAAGTCV
jgi:hypothetical protein